MHRNRRKFLILTAGSLAATAAGRVQATLTATPRQTAGPFYPRDFPLDSDNDLVQIQGHDQHAQGVICNVMGHVFDREGEPIIDAKVEIWQCNAHGRYHHPDDNSKAPIDEHFQGYGSTPTDASGRYRFRTIKPVAYGGRTPHIHFRITAPSGNELTTQMYIRGYPGNKRDGLFRRLGSEARKQAASAEFVKNPDDSAELMAQWDVVLG